MEDRILEMKHISKDYGGVHVLLGVNFNLKEGKILCLCRRNGAGKSTPMKILTRVEKPPKGEVYLRGRLAYTNRPIDVHRQGISIVHQELVWIPDMTTAENIFVGRYDKKGCFIDCRALTEKTNRLMGRLGIHCNPGAKIRQHSVAQGQLIEVIKTSSYDSSTIALDEPMAALAPDKAKVLCDIIRKLKQEGVPIILISRRVEDIYAVKDRIYVLRDGCYSREAMVKGVAMEDTIKMMIGRDIGQQSVQGTNRPGEVVLKVRNLTSQRVKDVSFQVRSGEVVGFGGLIGAGRIELLQAVCGVDSYKGEIYCKGKLIKSTSPRAVTDRGSSMISEDRKDKGPILSHSVQNDIQMIILDRISKMGLLSGKKGGQAVSTFIENLNIKTSGAQQKVGILNEGNQQKVVLVKCMAPDPSVVLPDEPTRGVGVGAKTEAYKIISDPASKGFAIIMVSFELPELIVVSDWTVVIREGWISREVNTEAVTEE